MLYNIKFTNISQIKILFIISSTRQTNLPECLCGFLSNSTKCYHDLIKGYAWQSACKTSKKFEDSFWAVVPVTTKLLPMLASGHSQHSSQTDQSPITVSIQATPQMELMLLHSPKESQASRNWSRKNRCPKGASQKLLVAGSGQPRRLCKQNEKETERMVGPEWKEQWLGRNFPRAGLAEVKTRSKGATPALRHSHLHPSNICDPVCKASSTVPLLCRLSSTGEGKRPNQWQTRTPNREGCWK